MAKYFNPVVLFREYNVVAKCVLHLAERIRLGDRATLVGAANWRHACGSNAVFGHMRSITHPFCSFRPIKTIIGLREVLETRRIRDSSSVLYREQMRSLVFVFHI